MQRLDIKRKLSARSDRVKSVDIHPTEPWVLASLYNGHVYLWNYSTQELVKTFEVTDLPVRAARFIARKQWLIAASDDMQIRVYNYNTMEKLKQFEAHSDYIRSLAVHPTQPFVLSSSDDMLIKLWDWEKGWQCTQVFEGHSHYVMMVTFNPKDTNTFASASLDRSVKVWGLGSNAAHFTLEGHEKGVNAVEYFLGGDKPYLLTGSDDATVKVWDYQHKSCVQTLEGHANNVSVVGFHAGLNLIVSGSEDGTLRLWHSNTYRLEKTLNYGLERVWALNLLKGSNKLAIGYDEGTVLLKLASEAPAVSMDAGGKIIWARQNEIQGAVLRLPGAASSEEGAEAAAPTGPTASIADGERVPVSSKELGTCEFSPAYLAHSHNGRFVVVCGDGEYVIYTALAWRNKTFGSAVEFVWGTDTGEYAIREAGGKVKVFSNFKETRSFRPAFSLEGLFGGALLGVRSTSFVCFYDWREDRMLRRIDVVPHGVFWSESGELVALACDTSFYLLRYARDKVQKAIESGAEVPEEGFEFAFEVLHEVNERVRTGHWVGDCFIYTNAQSRLNYCVGGEVATIAHLDRKLYLLGYLPRESRLFLADKQLNVLSYALHLGVINYQTHVLRKDWTAADALLPSIPVEQHNRIAAFLEAQGERVRALAVATDPDLRLDLALQLGKLDVAHSLAVDANSPVRWRQLGDLALASGKFGLAEECMAQSGDLNGLLLLHASLGAAPGLEQLVEMARDQGKANVAFLALLLLQRVEACAQLLAETGRIPEAAFFARTYQPSQVPALVKLWRADLANVNARAAEALADPLEYANLFPDLAMALKVETVLAARRRAASQPASSYIAEKESLLQDLVAEFKRLPPEQLAQLVSQASAAIGKPAAAAPPSPAPSSPTPALAATAPAPSTPAPAPVSAPAPKASSPPAPSPALTPAAAAAAPSPAPAASPAPVAVPAPKTSSPVPTPATPVAAAAPPPLPASSSPVPKTSSPAPTPVASSSPAPTPATPSPTTAPATPAKVEPNPAAPVAPSPAPAPATPKALAIDDEDDFEAFIAKAEAKAPASPVPAGSPAQPASAPSTPAKPPAPTTAFDDLLDWGDDK